MASAARMFDTHNTSSVPMAARPAFIVLEGGLSKGRTGATPAQPISKPVQELSHHQHVEPQKRVAQRSGAALLLVAALVSLAICVVSVIATHVIESKLSKSLASVEGIEYVVIKGDSLWSIASNNPIEGHSTSDVVTWISERNDLESGLIIPGQSLIVPAPAS